MTHCHICAVDVHPYQDMQLDGSLRDLCPKCNGAIATAPVVLTSAGTPIVGGIAAAVMPPAIIGHTKSGAIVHGTSNGVPQDPIVVLRARRAAVDAQIPTPDQMKALRTERDRLRRALKALGVDPAPKPN
jgi:hypothetical protein